MREGVVNGEWSIVTFAGFPVSRFALYILNSGF